MAEKKKDEKKKRGASGSWEDEPAPPPRILPAAASAPSAPSAIHAVVALEKGKPKAVMAAPEAPAPASMGAALANLAPQVSASGDTQPLVIPGLAEKKASLASLLTAPKAQKSGMQAFLERIIPAVTSLGVGAIAGKAAGIGAGSGLGLGAGTASSALARIREQEQKEADETRKEESENRRFAQTRLAGLEDMETQFGAQQVMKGQERKEKKEDFQMALEAEIAKEGRAFNYDKAKMALENQYKLGQISLQQKMEIDKELLKKQLERSNMMGEDPELNALYSQFGDDKEAVKQGREDLERVRSLNRATKEGGEFDKIYQQIEALEAKNRFPGSGLAARLGNRVTAFQGKHGREVEEINASIKNLAAAIMTSKGEDAKYSEQKIKALIEPFLYNPSAPLDETRENFTQLKENLKAAAGQSALLQQAGVHPGVVVVREAAFRAMSPQQKQTFVARGGKVKRADGRIE